MASQGRGARRKGSAFERTLSKKLSEELGIEFKRGLGQTRNGGKEVPDVYSEDLSWLHIEAKHQNAVSIKPAMKQAIEDSAPSGRIPIAITRDTGKDTLVTMLLEDFIPILRAYIKTR